MAMATTWESKLKSAGFKQVGELLAQWKDGVLTEERLLALSDAILAEQASLSAVSTVKQQQSTVTVAAGATPSVVDSSPVVAKLLQVSLLSPRGKFDAEFHSSGAITLRGKTGEAACSCPSGAIDTLFKLPIPQGAQKVRTVMGAAALRDEVGFGKSKLRYLVVQGKESDAVQASILDESAFGGSLDGLEGGALKGSPYDVFLKLSAALTKKKIQEHNKMTFLSFKAEAAVACNIKAVNDGHLFCLDAGMFFVSKFLFLSKRLIHSVDFGRTSSVSARTFDMNVVMKNGEKHDFSMIDKDEHQRLLEYAQALKLKPKEQAGALPKDGGKSAEAAAEEEQAAATAGSAAGPGEEEEEEEGSDEEEDDDFDPGDDDDDDESEGYDAVEAMDAEDIKAQEDEGGEDEEEEEGEGEGEQEDDDEGGEETDEEEEGEDGGAGAGSKRAHPIPFDAAKDKVAYRPGAPVQDDGGPGESKRTCL